MTKGKKRTKCQTKETAKGAVNEKVLNICIMRRQDKQPPKTKKCISDLQSLEQG